MPVALENVAPVAASSRSGGPCRTPGVTACGSSFILPTSQAANGISVFSTHLLSRSRGPQTWGWGAPSLCSRQAGRSLTQPCPLDPDMNPIKNFSQKTDTKDIPLPSSNQLARSCHNPVLITLLSALITNVIFIMHSASVVSSLLRQKLPMGLPPRHWVPMVSTCWTGRPLLIHSTCTGPHRVMGWGLSESSQIPSRQALLFLLKF